MQTHLNEITAAGLPLAANLQAIILLAKIPDSYKTLVSAMLSGVKLDDFTIDVVKEKVVSEENIRRSGAGPSRAQKTSQVKSKGNGPCSHCGNKSHDESHCWQKHPELKPKPKGKGKQKDNKDKKDKKDDKGKGTMVVATKCNTANVLTIEAGSNVTSSFYSATLVTASSKQEEGCDIQWIMDSGASKSITPRS